MPTFPFVIVEEGTCVVLEYFGKFYKILDPGFHVIPFFLCCSLREVDWEFTRVDPKAKRTLKTCIIPTNTQTFDPPSFRCLTSDGVSVSVDLIFDFRIENVRSAVFHVDDLFSSIDSFVVTALYAAVAQMRIEDVNPFRIMAELHKNGDLLAEQLSKVGRRLPVAQGRAH